MTTYKDKYKLANRFIFEPHSDLLQDSQTGEVFQLGTNESRLLLFLVEHSDHVVSREQLHQYVWRDQGFEVDDSSLTQAISTLRKALNDSTKTPQFIRTVPKRGYRLISTVEKLNEPSINSESYNIQALEQEIEELKPESIRDTADIYEEINIESAQDSQENLSSVSEPLDYEASNQKSSLNKPSLNRPSLNKQWFYLLWAIILIIPLGVIWYDMPSPTKFKTLGDVNGVSIIQPMNQQDLSPWFDEVKRCTIRYLNKLDRDASAQTEPTEKPQLEKVIISHSESDKLMANVIHDNQHTDKNRSLIFFLNSEDVAPLCP